MNSQATIITSARNRRVVEARKLDQRKHRERQCRFLVEGLQILHMALDAGARALEVYYCESLFVGTEAVTLLNRCREAGAEMIAVSENVLETLSRRDTPQGLVATFGMLDVSFEALQLAGNELIVVLDRLQDPGNVGTLVRTADAVGAKGIVLIEPCADPYDRKALRATMGSLFNVPLIRTSDVPLAFSHLRNQGLRPVAADARSGKAWGRGLWKGGVALVLGNEARGLSEDVRAQVTDRALLPIAGRAESLNVAVAGGVLMYAWLKDNSRERKSNSG